MSEGKRDLAIVTYRYAPFKKAGIILVSYVALIVVLWGAWSAYAYAAPRPVVPVPAEVDLSEWYDSLLEPMPHALDSTGWANAEVIKVYVGAYLAVMDPTSRATWQPGFIAYLQGLELTDVEIRARVLEVHAKLALEATNALFAELGKPSP